MCFVTSAQSITVGSLHPSIMKQFLVLLAVSSPLCLAYADAQVGGRYGHGHGHAVARQCQTTYDTATSQQCNTVTEQVCNTRSVTNYETRTEQECSSRPVQECTQVPRPVQEQVCTPTTEPECHNVVDVVQEQQCSQVPEEQCTTSQQCSATQQCQDEQQCSQEQVCQQEEQCSTHTTTTEQCQDVVEQVCSQAAPSLNHRIHKREAEADADAQYVHGLYGASGAIGYWSQKYVIMDSNGSRLDSKLELKRDSNYESKLESKQE